MKRFVMIMLCTMMVGALLIAGCSEPQQSPAPAPAPAPASTPAPASKPAPASTPAPGATILLKFASDIPEKGAISGGWIWFLDEIEKQSAGKVKVDRYWGGSLLKTAEQVDSLMAGVADITNMNISARRKLLPVSSVFQLPTTNFPDTPEGHRVARETVSALLDKYPELGNEYTDFRLMSWNTDTDRILISDREIRVPADLAGVKIGAEGMYQDIMTGAGAAPVFIVPPEAYMNMERGVINGAVVAWLHVQVFKYWEVASNYLDYGFGQGATCLIMNNDSWNDLPSDVQELMTSLLPEMEERCAKGLIGVTGAGKKSATDSGGAIYSPTAEEVVLWEAVKAPLEEQWLKDMQAQKVNSAAKILEELKQARNQAWGK